MRPTACLLALLLPLAARAADPQVTIDVGKRGFALAPALFGVNDGAPPSAGEPPYPVRRWGGNSTTRYNWQADVHNTAADYFFMNIADGDGTNLPDDSTADAFVAGTLAAGARPLLTVGTIGWTPLPERIKKWGFSIAKYGAQSSDECRLYGADPPFWCTADAGNGDCSSGPNCDGSHIVGNDPTDTSFATGADYAADWVTHLRARHGSAAAGGVADYALDNEPMLWNSTHRDVHPTPTSYDELWQKTVDYALAIKAVEPDARVFGPVTWGYCDLFGSAADGCLDGADRQAHGGLPLLRWYLRQVCAYADAHGTRPVDVVDLHYYPQGADIVDFDGWNIGTSEGTAASARRLRSLKELYDPAWVSESWLADLGDADANHYDKPQLLPRVRGWIDAECPGLPIAISEYNWGPDQGASSALAQAELFAIFAREGVSLATRWVRPASGSSVETAFRLWLDYDGAGHGIEGSVVAAASSDADTLSAYAFAGDDGRLFVLLVNHATTATGTTLSFAAPRSGAWRRYAFVPADNTIVADGTGMLDGTALTVAALPARSAALLVFAADGARVFADGFEGR